MTATTKDRDTLRRTGDRRSFNLPAGSKVLAGTIACLDSSGNLVMGSTSTSQTAVGVFEATVDNTAGTAPVVVTVPTGIYGPFDNSTSTDLIEDKNIGGTCYIVDNQTVAKTNGTNTRSKAGVIHKVDSEGVWVQFL